jgi:DNA-binding GntR family transcriptional regulator
MLSPVTTPSAASIARPSLFEQLADRLRQMIIEQDLPPGSRIDEKRLCEIFEISRTPLREALKVLASEGLVELMPNRSARVSALHREGVADMFDVISWLDREAGRLAARNITDGQLNELKKIHAKMVQLYKRGNKTEYFRLNGRLHQLIVEAAGNQVLRDMYANLLVHVQRARYFALEQQNHWERGVNEHEEILDALVRRDGQLASRLLYRHVRATGEQMMNLFQPREELEN